MQISVQNTDSGILYKLLTGLVIPRPIGWISTIDREGNNNLAPFSFFNVVGEDPPHVMFSTVRTGDKNKDTLNNVLQTGQFAVNLVTEDLVEQMNTTSGTFDRNTDEFQVAGLTPVACETIAPKRVAEAKAHFECEMVHHYFLEDHKNGGACVVIGKILMMHISEEIISDNYRIDLDKYRPVARLAGSNYSKLGEIFSVKRAL